MAKKGDVMRSDRLKQVMLEMDSGFDEKTLGYSKFSRFVSEAARKGLIETHKLENGQVEIRPGKGAKKGEERKSPSSREGKDRRPDRKRSSTPTPRPVAESPVLTEPDALPATTVSLEPLVPEGEDSSSAASPLRPDLNGASLGGAYALLRRAIAEIASEQGVDTVRDSDIKRRMLVLEPGFSEGDLGFPKFSRFLRQAHDHSVVEMNQGEGGSFQVALGVTDGVERSFPEGPDALAGEASPSTTPRGRGSSRGGRSAKASEAPATAPAPAGIPAAARDFPTGRDAVIQYLTAYEGVGRKTAETLVDAFGDDKIFDVFGSEPSRIQDYLPPARAEKVLEGWRVDLARRRSGTSAPVPSTESAASAAAPTASAQGGGAVSSTDPTAVDEAPAKSWGRRPRRTRSGAE
jgi:hypothetical protein